MHVFIILFIHVFFWFSYALFSALAGFELAQNPDFIKEYFALYVYNFIWAMCVFYTSYFWLFHYFTQKQFVRYGLLSVAVTLVISGLFFVGFQEMYKNDELTVMITFAGPAIGSFIICQCGSLVRGFIEGVRSLQKQKDIEHESLKNEMLALKAQLNPHFLFNTLNNIDALIYTNQDKASHSLVQLSSILRHLTYKSTEQKTLLSEEILLAENIIKLYQLRFSNPQFCSLKVKGSVEAKYVPSLVFLAFIENACKHVTDNGVLPGIEVVFDVHDQEVLLSCKNSCSEKPTTTGIGLQNIKRRLELIYGTDYDLHIISESDMFVVQLRIPLVPPK